MNSPVSPHIPSPPKNIHPTPLRNTFLLTISCPAVRPRGWMRSLFYIVKRAADRMGFRGTAGTDGDVATGGIRKGWHSVPPGGVRCPSFDKLMMRNGKSLKFISSGIGLVPSFFYHAIEIVRLFTPVLNGKRSISVSSAGGMMFASPKLSTDLGHL